MRRIYTEISLCNNIPRSKVPWISFPVHLSWHYLAKDWRRLYNERLAYLNVIKGSPPFTWPGYGYLFHGTFPSRQQQRRLRLWIAVDEQQSLCFFGTPTIFLLCISFTFCQRLTRSQLLLQRHQIRPENDFTVGRIVFLHLARYQRSRVTRNAWYRLTREVQDAEVSASTYLLK